MVLGTKSYELGRPPKGDLESLRVKSWYWFIAVKLNARSPYMVEKLFKPSYKFPQNEFGEIIRTREYDHRKKGKNKPNSEKEVAIEQCIKGSSAWLNHPLWDLLQVPSPPIQDIYKILLKLKPEISNLIFDFDTEPQQSPYRKKIPTDTYTILNTYSDIDAFMTCIGLMVEAKILDHKSDYITAAHYTHEIFCRVITTFPLSFIAEELFEYLKKHFYSDKNYISKKWFNTLTKEYLADRILQNSKVIHIIDSFHMRRSQISSIESCLYIAEQYLYPNDINVFWDTLLSNSTDEIKTHPIIMSLFWDIRKWEVKILINRETKVNFGQQQIRGHPKMDSIVTND